MQFQEISFTFSTCNVGVKHDIAEVGRHPDSQADMHRECDLMSRAVDDMDDSASAITYTRPNMTQSYSTNWRTAMATHQLSPLPYDQSATNRCSTNRLTRK